MSRRSIDTNGHGLGWWASNRHHFANAARDERRQAKRESDGDWDALDREAEDQRRDEQARRA